MLFVILKSHVFSISFFENTQQKCISISEYKRVLSASLCNTTNNPFMFTPDLIDRITQSKSSQTKMIFYEIKYVCTILLNLPTSEAHKTWFM